MRKIKTMKVFNLVNGKGTKLQLQQGIITEGLRDEYPIISSDKGYRWRFIGKEIPMPVRSYYWFNGFPEETMLNWLKANGWYPQTCVIMDDGSAKVYELPNGNVGTRESAFVMANDLPNAVQDVNKEAFHYAIRDLWCNGSKLKAVRLYRYAHGGTLGEATNAVRAICGEA